MYRLLVWVMQQAGDVIVLTTNCEIMTEKLLTGTLSLNKTKKKTLRNCTSHSGNRYSFYFFILYVLQTVNIDEVLTVLHGLR